MHGLAPSGFLRIGASDLEYRMIGPAPAEAPTIVMLHEGLGSAALWGDFPRQACRPRPVSACSPIRAPAMAPRARSRCRGRSITCMSRRSRSLPKLLDAIGFRRGLLLGHSDGASIAAIYAGGVQDHRVQGVAMIAPHFIVEDISVASIAEIKKVYETTDLKSKLARWHSDVDNAFYGWNGAWLDPEIPRLGYFGIPRLYPGAGRDPAGRRRPLRDNSPDRDRPAKSAIARSM